MERLGSTEALVVRQKKEVGEILTGFETKNHYVVMDAGGNELYLASEQGGSFILRTLLRALRPFTISLTDPQGNLVLRLQRPFRFYFHRLDVYDPQDKLLGSVQKRFSFFRRIYGVLDGVGTELFQLFGPILRPWTFKIRKGDEEVGRITKKWSGLLKEGFTDADNFGVAFSADTSLLHKALFLGAVFLIDFVHFENTGNR